MSETVRIIHGGPWTKLLGGGATADKQYPGGYFGESMVTNNGAEAGILINAKRTVFLGLSLISRNPAGMLDLKVSLDLRAGVPGSAYSSLFIAEVPASAGPGTVFDFGPDGLILPGPFRLSLTWTSIATPPDMIAMFMDPSALGTV